MSVAISPDMLAAHSLLLARAFALVTAASLAVACTASSGDETDGTEDPASATGEDALTSTRSVSLMYEGSCAFLHNCSAWSRKLPVGQVQWGCGGTDCSDDELWIAGPSHSYCNRKAKICHGTRCTTATVRDISDAHGWEASNGVMDALGLPHTVNVAACNGGGGGKVTVQLL
jgi:hypothetical protein